MLLQPFKRKDKPVNSQESESPVWRIELFGGVRAVRGRHILSHFRTKKTAALLAFLAFYREEAHLREKLADLFWPKADPDAAQRSLSVELSWLRSHLKLPGLSHRAIIMGNHDTLQIDPGIVTTDVAEFEASIRKAREAADTMDQVRFLTSAVEQYRSELATGFYQDWIMVEQAVLCERFVEAALLLIDILERTGNLEQALLYARKAVQIDPLSEDLHHRAIHLHAVMGQTTAALRQYQEMEQVLRRELDASPSPPLRQLRNEIESLTARSPATLPLSVRTLPPEMALAPSPSGMSTMAAVDPVPTGGPLPPDSRYYVVRSSDHSFGHALQRKDGIILAKGTRQSGKSSLLIRGLKQAREAGAQVVFTDFQRLGKKDLESDATVLLALAESVAEQLSLPSLPDEKWRESRSANINFDSYLRREVLDKLSSPLIWGMDGVDRLLRCPFALDIFALFRFWYNDRARDASGPFNNLTLVMTYAAEIHLFISDDSLSPFNVGTQLSLEDFSLEEVADLSARYGSPLRTHDEVAGFFRLLGGHPFLTHQGLREMAHRNLEFSEMQALSLHDERLFAHHLRRLHATLSQDLALCEAIRAVLEAGSCPTLDAFYRLRSAGILSGCDPKAPRLRCLLYEDFLRQSLQ